MIPDFIPYKVTGFRNVTHTVTNHILKLNPIAMEALLYLSLSTYQHSTAVLLSNGTATIF